MLKAGVQIYEKQFHSRYFDWFIPLLRKHILFIQKSNAVAALWENARVSYNFCFFSTLTVVAWFCIERNVGGLWKTFHLK